MFEGTGWQTFIEGQEIVIAMRFSYFGTSGWQGEASRQKEMLFDPTRLARRLELLRSLALPSLAAQTDRNFHLMVLCSEDMPTGMQQALRDACGQMLSADQHSILPRPYGRAPKYLTQFLRQRYGAGPVIQTVLDDDDAFASDLITGIRQELTRLPQTESREAMRFVSFADGFGLDVTAPNRGPRLYRHRYPYVNLGLGMVSDVTGKNILSIAHQKTPKQHPTRLVKGRPMFVRGLHGLNDSRVSVSERWKELPDWQGDPEIALRFPWLAGLGG
jgi:Putative rhamnosyl transferase